MRVHSGHLAYLLLETPCQECRKPVRYEITASPIKEFPKGLRFGCRHCGHSWLAVVRLEATEVEYLPEKNSWFSKLYNFWFK